MKGLPATPAQLKDRRTSGPLTVNVCTPPKKQKEAHYPTQFLVAPAPASPVVFLASSSGVLVVQSPKIMSKLLRRGYSSYHLSFFLLKMGRRNLFLKLCHVCLPSINFRNFISTYRTLFFRAHNETENHKAILGRAGLPEPTYYVSVHALWILSIVQKFMFLGNVPVQDGQYNVSEPLRCDPIHVQSPATRWSTGDAACHLC